MTRQPLTLGVICLLLTLGACSAFKVSTEAARVASAKRGLDQGGQPPADDDHQAPEAGSVDAAESRLARLLLAEGGRLEAQGRCRDALQHYQPAALQPGSTQGQALAAVYRCQWQLQQPQAAQATFGRFIAHELAQSRLPLKLLFQPGQSRYLADTRVSGPYGMWLRQLAGPLLGSRACLSLIGHAGPSAVEQETAELPLRRAQAVQRQLEALAPALAGRLRSEAATPDEALVGSASDDWRDALDRRVDFKLRPC